MRTIVPVCLYIHLFEQFIVLYVHDTRKYSMINEKAYGV